MPHPNSRQGEYKRLSKWVQKVILGVGRRSAESGIWRSGRSAAERGAESARHLGLSSSGTEAQALRGMGESLEALNDANSAHRSESEAAVIAAAEALGEASSDFVNPPLNSIWAEAGRREDEAREVSAGGGGRAASAAPARILNVLVADGEPRHRESMERAVRSLGYSCTVARDGAQAWEMYEAGQPDVILADWAMPRLDGLALCKKIRAADARHSYTHFIFVTAKTDKAHFIHAMNAGADDYITKPVDLDDLRARLAAADRLVTRDRRLSEKSASLAQGRAHALLAARTDSLTETHNRLALAEDLGALAARASRYGHKYCAALCDIDDFKAYNDHFGHLPGDLALRSVAGAIHRQLRRGDALYRYGGEEFLVILPEQSVAHAAVGMERVRQGVERLALQQAPGARSPILTISVGVSAMTQASAESADVWLRRTDDALCAAKSRGRNCVAIEGQK